MAKRDLYNYYNNSIRQVTQLNQSIQDLQKEIESGKAQSLDSDKMEYLSNMVQMMRANCDSLSYMIFLLNQPRFGIFKKRYNQQNASLLERFKELKVTEKDKLESSQEMLDKIEEYLDYCKKEIDND